MSAATEMPGGVEPVPADGSGFAPDGTPQPAPEGAQTTAGGETLEQIEQQRRQLQSKLDKALPWARLAEHPRIAGASPDAIVRFLEEMIPLTQRPDFEAFRAGQAPAQEPDDEMLSDEQRELRELRNELLKLKNQGQAQNQEGQRFMVEARFERAEKEVADLLGPAWNERRPKVLEQIQQLARTVSGAPNAITPMLLIRAYANSFEDPESFFEAMTHHVQRREKTRLEQQQRRGTTVPQNIVPGGVPPKAPKSFGDAWALGLRDLQEPPAR